MQRDGCVQGMDVCKGNYTGEILYLYTNIILLENFAQLHQHNIIGQVCAK